MRAGVRATISQPTKAAVERATPVTLGAAAGIVALLLAPGHAGTDYYTVAAQVVPVLLLALAIEARAFGGRVRRFPGGWSLAQAVEWARWFLGLGIVAALIASEWCALRALINGGGARDPGVVYLGLAAGCITVAALAFLGARPRVTATVTWKVRDATSVIIRAGMGNQYGDREITPLMNLLVSGGASIVNECDEEGTRKYEPEQIELLSTVEPYDRGEPITWKYAFRRERLTAGDATVAHYLLGLAGTAGPFAIKLRLDHGELPRGRVEDKGWVNVSHAGDRWNPLATTVPPVGTDA